ncbi:MAG: hypothetical protein IKL83_07655 [Muribaculaceae bacterium]|nr:hypothetical protein [Muribaculaceae bacterium]
MKSKITFTAIISLCFMFFSCSTKQEKGLSDEFLIANDGTMTDHDKQNVNHYNYFVEMADSLIVYHRNYDLRHMGQCIVAMNRSRDKISWFSHPNDKLKKKTSENISKIQSKLDSLGVPQEVTYPINVGEIYLYPKNGVIEINTASPSNNFKLYNASIDSEGNLVRTVHRRHILYEATQSPIEGVYTIKDLTSTYTLKVQNGFKASPKIDFHD